MIFTELALIEAGSIGRLKLVSMAAFVDQPSSAFNAGDRGCQAIVAGMLSVPSVLPEKKKSNG